VHFGKSGKRTTKSVVKIRRLGVKKGPTRRLREWVLIWGGENGRMLQPRPKEGHLGELSRLHQKEGYRETPSIAGSGRFSFHHGQRF